MNKERYEKSMKWVDENIGVPGVQLIVKEIFAITVIFYFCILAMLALENDPWFFYVLLVPGVSFLILSLFRKKYNAKRPYEVYDFKPLLDKDTTGNSFPSRHVFSIFMIAMAVMSVNVPGGIFLLCLGVLLAVLRVMTGVHFIKDVAAGAFIGILCGLAGLFL